MRSGPVTSAWHGRAAPRRGFTIIEAVVLISVMGILAAVTAPRFLVMSEMESVQAHREALAHLRYAQRLASASGCPVEVDFDASGYVLRRRTGCRSGAFTQPVIDPSTQRSAFAITLPSGLALSSSVDPLRFDALGRATTASNVVRDATIEIGPHRLEAIGETGLVRVP
jgi:MSHA pilin protein MshC